MSSPPLEGDDLKSKILALIAEHELAGTEAKTREPDFEIVDLPPHPRNTRDRLLPLFLRAVQIHRHHPDAAQHQAWIRVYDRSRDFAMSLPRKWCVEGAESMEQIDNEVKESVRLLKKRSSKYPELGKFEVRRRGGAIYLKHVGKIPKEDVYSNWI